MRSNAEANVVPLLEGRVTNGRVVSKKEAHAPGVGGMVLEIGPGSGMWVSLFSDEKYLKDQDEEEEEAQKVNGEEEHNEGLSESWATIPSSDQQQQQQPPKQTSSTPKTQKIGTRQPITQIYGVEPNYDIHPLLQHNITQAGLSQTYTILPFGIEDIERYAPQIAPESLDCIVSILCLCSIPEPQKNIGILYRYLKPGGRWFVYEHVKCCSDGVQGGWFMNAYQAFVNLFWPVCLGGCQLRRDTGRYLREAGPWTDVDLAQPPKEQWHQTVPHIYGILTK